MYIHMYACMYMNTYTCIYIYIYKSGPVVAGVSTRTHTHIYI